MGQRPTGRKKSRLQHVTLASPSTGTGSPSAPHGLPDGAFPAASHGLPDQATPRLTANAGEAMSFLVLKASDR